MTSLKSILYSFIATFGLPSGIHRLLYPSNISILMYHGIVDNPLYLPDWCLIDSSSFRNQLQYLKRHFNIVSLTDAVALLASGNIDEPTAVITFDDGYQNNYDCAFPILREAGIPATIFLTTGLLDTNLTVWTGHLHDAFANTSLSTISWRGQTFDISTKDNKLKSLQAIKNTLKHQDHSYLQKEVYEIVCSLVGDEGYHINENSPYRMLSEASIRKMQDSGLIEFGAHTHNHPILSNLSKDRQEFEIGRSIEKVGTLIGKPCTLFAYPNGSKNDYSDITISILKEHGITIALTTIEDTCKSGTPNMELRRFSIGSNMNLANFKLTVHNTINMTKMLFN